MFLLSPRVSRTSVSSATDVARKHAFFWPIATHKVPFSETHRCCCAQTLHFLNHQSTGDPWRLVYHPAVKTPSGRRRQRAREIEKRSVMTEKAPEWTLLTLTFITFSSSLPCFYNSSGRVFFFLTRWVRGQPAGFRTHLLLFLTPFTSLLLFCHFLCGSPRRLSL